MIKKSMLIALTILFIVLLVGKLYPELIYLHKFKYKNYTLYSNSNIDSSAIEIINSSNELISNDYINSESGRYDVFFCNSYHLFWLHTFLGRKPSGASDLATNNIYLANVDIIRDKVFNSEKDGKVKGRTIKSVIAHESTHIILRKQLGLKQYRKLIKTENWKIEGICEWIAFSDEKIDRNQMLKLIESRTYHKNPWHRYQLFRFAVTYLIETKGYNLEDIVLCTDAFDIILQEI